MPNNSAKAYAVDAVTDTVVSTWLIKDGSNAYQKNFSENDGAGVVSGYGYYQIGKPATLTSQANEGFVLYGWKIKDQIITSTTTIDGTVYTVNQQTLHISEVKNNTTVDAIYDYCYYNVTVNQNIINVAKLSKETLTINDVDYEIYYSSKSGSVYSNAFIKSVNIYTYYPTLRYNTILYTTHTDTDKLGNTIATNIDVVRGAFRKDETATMTLSIKTTSDVLASKNIDLISASSDELDNVSLVKSTDAYNRTIGFMASFKVLNSNANLTFDYDNLYVATIDYKLDGESIDNGHIAYDYILNAINIMNTYSEILPDKQYFVKNSTDFEDKRIFGIKCLKSIIDNDKVYYDFESVAGQTDVVWQKGSFNDNINIEVKYLNRLYDVSFKFALLTKLVGGEQYLDTTVDFGQVIETSQFVRGNGKTYLETDALANTGYSFYGYSLDGSISNEKSITVTIDLDRPEDMVVYMIYTQIEYTVKLTNFNKVQIGTSPNITYPLKNLVVKQNGITTFTTNANYLNTSPILAKVTVGENISLEYETNVGFNILGFKHINSELASYSTTFEFNEQYIKDFATDTDIFIYVFEEYVTYNLTYYIDAKQDANITGEPFVIMANIGVTTPSHITADQITTNNTELKTEIVVSGLRYNDVVDLSAIAKEAEIGGYKYRFEGFTETGKVNIAHTNYDEAEDKYTLSQTITKDIALRVIYNLPKTKLYVFIDNPDAYDISQLLVYPNGSAQPCKKVVDQNSIYFEVEKGVLQVNLNPANVTDLITFGYYLKGYTFNGIVEDNNSETFTIEMPNLEQELIFNLTINCPKVNYNYIMELQNHAGQTVQNITYLSTIEKIVIESEIETVSLLELDVPEGYFVKDIYFDDIKLEGWGQTKNDKIYTRYVTVDELKTLTKDLTMVNGQYNIDLDVKLEIISFSITIDLISTEKTNGYDDLTTVVDINIQGDNNIIKQSLANKYIISRIPYGSTVTFTINDIELPNHGLMGSSWRDAFNKVLTTSKTYSVSNIQHDNNFIYSVSYLTYKLTLDYEDLPEAKEEIAQPQVKVNEQEISTVTLFDDIRILPNALKQNGVKFVAMYQKYVYSDQTWAELWDNLYVKDGNNYILNTDSSYNISKVYCAKMETTIIDNEHQYFDSKFELKDYYLSSFEIVIFVQYDWISVSINNTNKYSKAKDSIAGLDIANATQFIVYKNGVLVNNLEEQKFTINDKIIIKIIMNNFTVVLNEDKNETIDVNLIDALSLDTIEMLGNSYKTYSTNEKGYEFAFLMSDIMHIIDDTTENLDIVYSYIINQKTFKFTTSVTNDKFYAGQNGGNISLTTKIGTKTVFNDKKYLTVDIDFGKEASCTYSLIGNYSKYFNIDSYRVYDESGDLINLSKYKEYGIKYSEEVLVPIKFVILKNLTIELVVNPKIEFNTAINAEGHYIFERTFLFDEMGNGIPQTLSMGTNSQTKYDISTASIILNSFISSVLYYPLTDGEVSDTGITNPTNVGVYQVKWKYDVTGANAWLSGITNTYSVYLKINQKQISIKFDDNGFSTIQKPYDGKENIDFSLIKSYLYVDLGENKHIKITGNNPNFYLIGNPDAIITVNDGTAQKAISQANENDKYNISVSNINFQNKNFALDNSTLVIYGVIKIMRASLYLEGVEFYDKVYDTTTDILTKENMQLKLNGIKFVDGVQDNVGVDIGKITFKFVDAEIDANKKVVANVENALIGTHARNYKIVNVQYNKLPSIYPYSITADAGKYGTIELFNERGRNNPKDESLVALIPIDAEFKVSVIEPNSVEYVNIYPYISQFIRGNRVFGVAFNLSLEVYGVKHDVSNQLMLKMPTNGEVMAVLSLAGEQSSEFSKFSLDGGTIILDLSQVDIIDGIVIINQRILFKLWQLILIVGSVVFVLVAVIITIVIIRRKKMAKYSINDKI